MGGIKGFESFRDTVEDLGYWETLADHTCRHDQSAALIPCLGLEVGVHSPCHFRGILEAAFPRHCIGTASIDNDGSEPVTLTLLQRIPTHQHRGCLTDILGEDGGGRTGSFRCDQSKIRKFGV